MDSLIELGIQTQFDNSLLKIKKTTQSIIKTFIKSSDGWITDKAKFYPNNSYKHIQKACMFIRNNNWKDEFIEANEKHGYDAGEFLIIEKGFVAVVDEHLLYCSENVTLKQAELAGFTRLRGILKHLDYSDEISFIPPQNKCYSSRKVMFCMEFEKQQRQKKKKSSFNLEEYYSKPENQFHSPSGIPRIGYQNFLKSKRGQKFRRRINSFWTS